MSPQVSVSTCCKIAGEGIGDGEGLRGGGGGGKGGEGGKGGGQAGQKIL